MKKILNQTCEKVNTSSYLKINTSDNIISSQAIYESHSNIPTEERKAIALWRAVILQAILDAATDSAKPRMKSVKKAALEWLDINNPDFIEVCSYAKYSPTKVIAKAHNALNNKHVWKKNMLSGEYGVYKNNTKSDLSDLDFDRS